MAKCIGMLLILALGAAAGIAAFSFGVIPDNWIPPALSERNDANPVEATATPTPAPATATPTPVTAAPASPRPAATSAVTLRPTPTPRRAATPTAASALADAPRPSATPTSMPTVTPTPSPSPTPTPTPGPAATPTPTPLPTTLMYPADPNEYYPGGHTQAVAIESGTPYDVYLTWRCGDDLRSCKSSFRFDNQPVMEYYTFFGPGASYSDKRTCILTTRNRDGEHEVSVEEGHWRVRFERRGAPCDG